jgi:hypothetical protein
MSDTNVVRRKNRNTVVDKQIGPENLFSRYSRSASTAASAFRRDCAVHQHGCQARAVNRSGKMNLRL